MLGILIHKELDGNSQLNNIIKKNTYPLVVPDGIEIPHIAYGVRVFPPDYSKVSVNIGQSVVDHSEAMLEISSSKYKELQEIMGYVRVAIEGKKLIFQSIETKAITLYSQEEHYNNKTRNYNGVMVFKVDHNRLING